LCSRLIRPLSFQQEVIARRALLRWLYGQAEAALTAPGGRHTGSGCPSGPRTWADEALLRTGDGRLRLKDGLHMHMYVSMPPCGDAAVYGQRDAGLHLEPREVQEGATPGASRRISGGAAGPGDPLHSTGAKVVGAMGTVPQSHEVEGPGLQKLGCVRRKPGRGAATLSMSCSDKMAKWCMLGLQGCLLSGFLAEPLLLTSITVSLSPRTEAEAGCASGAEAAALGALWRATVDRCASLAPRLRPPYRWAPPQLYIAPPLPASLRLSPQPNVKAVLSGLAVNWSAAAPVAMLTANKKGRIKATGAAATTPVHEVTLAASGRKAGANKKSPAWNSAKTRSSLSKLSLLDQATALFHLSHGDTASAAPISTYREAKLVTLGREYHECWARLREEPSVFAHWLLKPSGWEDFGPSSAAAGNQEQHKPR